MDAESPEDLAAKLVRSLNTLPADYAEEVFLWLISGALRTLRLSQVRELRDEVAAKGFVQLLLMIDGHIAIREITEQHAAENWQWDDYESDGF